MTFTSSDQTQYEFLDVVSQGAVASPNFNRGHVFKTYDGSALTFVSDTPAIDNQPLPPGSGFLYFPDGRQFRFDNGLVSNIRDRNGNFTYFTYAGDKVASVTDSLNRTVLFGYQSVQDEITYKGFGGATRTVRVNKSALSAALTAGTVQTLGQLFPAIDWANPAFVHDPEVVASVELPDGRTYILRYNPYGELAEVTLPTGGWIEYTYGAGRADLPPAGEVGSSAIYRRLLEKNVYDIDSTHVLEVRYSQEPTTGTDAVIEERHIQPSTPPTDLLRVDHTFHGRASDSFFAPPAAVGDRPSFEKGREYQTETWDGSAVARKEEHTWAPRVAATMGKPAQDPRIAKTRTTLTTVADTKVSEQQYDYDQFNNRTETREYGFGITGPDVLIRRSTTEYVTAASYTQVAPGTAHLRRLPLVERVYDAANNEKARTSYAYDVYSPIGLTVPSNPSGRIEVSGADVYGTSWTTRGNVTSIHRWNNQPGGDLVSRREYDILGNVVAEFDARGHETEYAYSDRFGTPNGDALGNAAPPELAGKSAFAFVTQRGFQTTGSGGSVGHLHRTQWDYYLGRPVDEQDPNGSVTSTWFEDPLDRPTKRVVANHAGSTASAQTLVTYFDSHGTRKVQVLTDQDELNDRLTRTESFYDGLGRTFEQHSYDTAGTYIVTRKSFDGLGRVVAVTNPHVPGDAIHSTVTTYDGLGRVRQVAAPQGTLKTTYVTNKTFVVDEANKAREVTADAAGRTTQVIEDPGGSLNYVTTYAYDVLDNVTQVTQGSQVRTLTYDSLSRLLTSNQPESGLTSYLQYDANGNLLQKKDARNVFTNSTYDELNRILARSYTDLTPSVAWTYDDPAVPNSKGRLTRVQSDVSRTDFSAYDPLGRVTQSRQITDGQTHEFSYTYDLASRLTSRTYPSGRVVTTQYDRLGRPTDVKDGSGAAYAGSFTYAPHGAPIQLQLGNTLWERTDFNGRLQATVMGLGPIATSTGLLRVTNEYTTSSGDDNNGNVYRQTIRVNGQDIVQDYEYDGANRLESATEAGSWVQNYGYDRFGNRWVSSGDVLDAQLTPDAQSDFNPATNRLTGAAYDAAGNLTQDQKGVLYTYDAEHRQKTAGSSSYHYDGLSKRIRKVVAGATTTFVYDAQGRLALELNTTPLAGTRYLTGDHLGSTRIVTDQSGAIVSRHDHLPFGEEIPSGFSIRSTVAGYGSNPAINQRFTGKERDFESGLDYFGARYYSGPHGRFTSADLPLIDQYLSDPRSLNLYSYVRNTPLNAVDQTGRGLVWRAAKMIFKLAKDELGKPIVREGRAMTTLVGPVPTGRLSEGQALRHRKAEGNLKLEGGTYEERRSAANKLEDRAFPKEEHRYDPKDSHKTGNQPHVQTRDRKGHIFFGTVIAFVAPYTAEASNNPDASAGQVVGAALFDTLAAIDPAVITEILEWTFDLDPSVVAKQPDQPSGVQAPVRCADGTGSCR